MISLNHLAIYMIARHNFVTLDEVKKEIPYLLLPDAIRMYTSRQSSHFEVTSNGKSFSWLRFPEAEELKLLFKGNEDILEYGFAIGGYPKAVIGEQSSVEAFDKFNKEHSHYKSLKCHLLQDIVHDKALRENWMDTTRKYEDTYVLRHSGEEIDGIGLRRAIDALSYLQFVKFAEIFYDCSGVLLNNEWLHENVYSVLCNAYHCDMAENTFKYMILPEDVEQAITLKTFKIERNGKLSIFIDDGNYLANAVLASVKCF